MISLDGMYYDGSSSLSFPARARVWPDFNCINISADEFEQEYPLSEVKISARVDNMPRRLEFPDGSAFETSNNVGVDALLPKKRQMMAPGSGGRRWGALFAMALAGLAAWAAFVWGLPWLAGRAAFAIPADLEAQISRQALEALDRQAFSPSKLPVLQQERGRQVFASLLAGIGEAGKGRLEFRAMHGNLANAFSLPAGVVVVTDRLMELADQDKELQALLAHELGHANLRHSLRSWLQSSPSALLAASVLGDAKALGTSAEGLPAVLLQTSYPPAFEDAADDFAFGVLEKRGVPACYLGPILKKLELVQPKDAQGFLGFLSIHASTEKRAERLQSGGGAGCGRP